MRVTRARSLSLSLSHTHVLQQTLRCTLCSHEFPRGICSLHTTLHKVPHHFAQSSTPLCTIWVIRGTIWVSLHAAARWDRETITIWVMIDTIWVVWSTIWEEGSAPEPCLHTICLPTPTQITRRNIGKLCDVIRSEVSFLRPRPSY